MFFGVYLQGEDMKRIFLFVLCIVLLLCASLCYGSDTRYKFCNSRATSGAIPCTCPNGDIAWIIRDDAGVEYTGGQEFAEAVVPNQQSVCGIIPGFPNEPCLYTDYHVYTHPDPTGWGCKIPPLMKSDPETQIPSLVVEKKAVGKYPVNGSMKKVGITVYSISFVVNVDASGKLIGYKLLPGAKASGDIIGRAEQALKQYIFAAPITGIPISDVVSVGVVPEFTE